MPSRFRRRSWIAGILLAGGAWGGEAPVHAVSGAGFIVDSTFDGVDNKLDGVCRTAAGTCTLRAAVTEANATAGPDVITLPEGEFALTIPPTPMFDASVTTGDLEITDALTINGAGPGLTIVDAAGLDRIFEVTAGTFEVTIQGLTLRDGNARDGGAIFNAAVLHLAHCEVTQSTSTNSGGGGIQSYSGATLTVDDCSITQNTETNSGGGGIASAGVLTVRHSLIDGNVAAWAGGGLSQNGGTAVVEDSTVSNNQSLVPAAYLFYGGGGIAASGGFLTIRNSTISGNSAVYSGGGGLQNIGNITTLVNVTISGNSAATAGGGVWNNFSGGTVNLRHSTIAGNTAGTGGGGIDATGGSPASYTLLAGTILANNAGGNCLGAMESWGYNLDSGTGCGFADPGDITGADPLLGPLADNGGPTATHALLALSPAIDAADPACTDYDGTPLASDGRGAARPLDGGTGTPACDIGSYERYTGTDLILADGFEGGNLAAWSASATDGGNLSVNASAALDGTALGLRGVVNDTSSLYVEDDSPADESHYRARFHFDPNGFNPGESASHFRIRIFVAFEESPTRRLAAVVLKRQGGVFSLMTRVRLDDDTQAETGFIAVSNAPHFVEVDWRRSRGPGANDGRLGMWIDSIRVADLTGLDNSASAVDFARLGALSIKSGATGTIYWDEFVSRRQTYIGR